MPASPNLLFVGTRYCHYWNGEHLCNPDSCPANTAQDETGIVYPDGWTAQQQGNPE